MKHLIIIGARGFGREVLWTAIGTQAYKRGKYDIKGFLDDKVDALDNLKGDFPPIIGPVETYQVQPDDVFFCALGDAYYRKKYSEIIENKGGKFISIISSDATISNNAIIGDGTFIGGYTIVSDNVSIGKHSVILSFADLGHNAVVGNYATIASYVFLGGDSVVGSMATMNTKSTLLPKKKVGDNALVGVNSVVMKNVKDGQHVFGNPAVKIEF